LSNKEKKVPAKKLLKSLEPSRKGITFNPNGRGKGDKGRRRPFLPFSKGGIVEPFRVILGSMRKNQVGQKKHELQLLKLKGRAEETRLKRARGKPRGQGGGGSAAYISY